MKRKVNVIAWCIQNMSATEERLLFCAPIVTLSSVYTELLPNFITTVYVSILLCICSCRWSTTFGFKTLFFATRCDWVFDIDAFQFSWNKRAKLKEALIYFIVSFVKRWDKTFFVEKLSVIKLKILIFLLCIGVVKNLSYQAVVHCFPVS